MADRVSLTIVGSVNLDLVARGSALPAPGETVTGARLERHPGGKGANMALAARRLGADVSLIARVGQDGFADEALALLRESDANLKDVTSDPDASTGVALIAVSEAGENQIIVASGANDTLSPRDLPQMGTPAVLCVLEVPVETIVEAGRKTDGFFVVNLAPAIPVPNELFTRSDLIIVNEGEAAFYGDLLNTSAGLVAVTLGAKGAVLYKGDEKIAEAFPPQVEVIDTTGAGDTFSAALTLALCEGMSHKRALEFAVAASSLAVTIEGAQPSLPMREDVERLL